MDTLVQESYSVIQRCPYVEVILYSKECNWYTRCCPLNGGVRYRECPLREAILLLLFTVVLLRVDVPVMRHLRFLNF